MLYDPIDGRPLAHGDDGAAEARSCETCAERTCGHELLDENVELRDRDAKVVAEARVAFGEQGSNALDVALGE